MMTAANLRPFCAITVLLRPRPVCLNRLNSPSGHRISRSRKLQTENTQPRHRFDIFRNSFPESIWSSINPHIDARGFVQQLLSPVLAR